MQVSLIDQFYIFGAQYLFLLSFIIAGIYFFKQSSTVKKEMILCGILSVSIIGALALVGGHLYNNPRPFVVGNFTPLIPHSADNGFPSDHVLLVSAISAVVYFFNRKVGFVLLLVAILVGISRVYVGVHHPVDVIASMIFSFVGASGGYILLKYFKSKKA